MPTVQINYVAVIVAAIINMVLGYIWYGPLFGRQWMQMMGMKMENVNRAEMPRIYSWTFVTALVTAYVLARIVDWAAAKTFGAGMVVGFWVWLGFVATVTAAGVLFERRPTGLYVLNNGYQLVALAITGGLLAAWA